MKNLLIILFALWGVNLAAQTQQCVQNNLNTYLDLKEIAVETALWSTANNPFGVASSTQAIRVNENLIIPSGVHLTIDGLTFEFGTQGRIIVESEATLTCLNSSFLGDPICETMWQGIQVAGPGIDSGMESAHLKGILNMDNCVVEDAIVGVANMIIPIFDFEAIENGSAFLNFQNFTPIGTLPQAQFSLQNLWQASSRNSAGGELSVTNTIFDNCFEGIDVSWKTIFNSSNIFVGNQFNSDYLMNYPFNTSIYMGNSIAGINGLYVESIGRIYDNDFGAVYYGVRANGVDVFNINDCFFEQTSVGISARHYFNSSKHQTIVSDNEFNSCIISMQFDGNDNTLIENNQMTNNLPLNTACIPTPLGCMSITSIIGVFLRGSDFAFRDNSLSGMPYHIILTDNDSDGSHLLRTTSIDSDISLMAFGDNTGVQLKCNDLIDYNLFGIFINEYSLTGEAGDLGEQGRCLMSDYPLNIFDPSNGTAFDIFFGNNTNPLYYEDIVLPTSIGGNTVNFIGQICSSISGINFNTYCANVTLKSMTEINDLESETAKNKALSEWVFEYVKDSNFVALKELILSENTSMTQRRRIPEKLIDENLPEAQSLLDEMETTKEEDDRYKQYYQLMLEVKQTGRTVFELTTDELLLLDEIANSRTKTAFKAQGLLFIIQGRVVVVDFPELPDGTILQTAFKAGNNNNNFNNEVNQLTIYPNPAKDLITLEFDTISSGKIQLVNILGKIVLEKNIEKSNKETLDVSGIKTGIYFIKIHLENQKVQTEKVIINR